jgi:hypothetical protein
MRVDHGEYRAGGRRFRPRLERGSFGRRRFAGLRFFWVLAHAEALPSKKSATLRMAPT